MPRRPVRSTSLLAQVRRYFGLPQWELAAFLGVSPELVKHIEAGRRGLSSAVLLRLNELARLVPATFEPGSGALPDAPPERTSTTAPDLAPLLARLDTCQQRARQKRRQLASLEASLETELALARRWEQALPPLLAAAPAAADTSAGANQRRRWLAARQQELAQTPDPAMVARYHLLRVRTDALEAEAAALRALLPPAAVATLPSGTLLP